MKIRNIVALSLTTLLFACSIPESSGYTAKELNSEIDDMEYEIVEIFTETCTELKKSEYCAEYMQYLRDSLEDEIIIRREYNKLLDLHDRAKSKIRVKRLKDTVDS